MPTGDIKLADVISRQEKNSVLMKLYSTVSEWKMTLCIHIYKIFKTVVLACLALACSKLTIITAE